jgi:hypothetical protein
MDPVSVHAFAPVFGKKSRMNIDYPVLIPLKNGIGNKPEESGQNNKIDPVVFEVFQNPPVYI